MHFCLILVFKLLHICTIATLVPSLHLDICNYKEIFNLLLLSLMSQSKATVSVFPLRLPLQSKDVCPSISYACVYLIIFLFFWPDGRS